MSQKKHIAKLREMVPSDWEIKIGAHIKLVSPDGFTVTCGNTISDHRAYENIKRDIRATLRRIEEHKAKKAAESETSQAPETQQPKFDKKKKRRKR